MVPPRPRLVGGWRLVALKIPAWGRRGPCARHPAAALPGARRGPCARQASGVLCVNFPSERSQLKPS